MKIYKQKLPLVHGETISIPDCSEVLSIGIQDGEPMAWYIYDEGSCSPLVYCAWTGNDFDIRGFKFKATVLLRSGIVCHYFESSQ